MYSFLRDQAKKSITDGEMNLDLVLIISILWLWQMKLLLNEKIHLND
jgi:hypothetical protein